jgi:hypothetical protein
MRAANIATEDSSAERGLAMKAIATVLCLALLMNVGSACACVPDFKFDFGFKRIWPLAYHPSPFVSVPATAGALTGGVAGLLVGIPAGLVVAGPEFLVRKVLRKDPDNLTLAGTVFLVPVAVGSVGTHYVLGGPSYLVTEVLSPRVQAPAAGRIPPPQNVPQLSPRGQAPASIQERQKQLEKADLILHFHTWRNLTVVKPSQVAGSYSSREALRAALSGLKGKRDLAVVELDPRANLDGKPLDEFRGEIEKALKEAGFRNVVVRLPM